MNIRNYNIYFHTHTISGIIITAILYVIFFAGSFSFFKDEISNWQKNRPNNSLARHTTNYNALIDSLDQTYKLQGRDLSLFFHEHSRQIRVSISEPKDTTVVREKKRKRDRIFFGLDPVNFKAEKYKEGYDLGEFLYRLHFLAPLNGVVKLGFPIGYYIAGSIAIMFLFALITGLLVHWEKITSNFYLFRPWEKLKTVWTDMHTALGVISFPFLLVFAVTGAYFLVSSVLFAPAVVKFEYGGNADSMYADMGYKERSYPFSYQTLIRPVNYNAYIDSAYTRWGNDININSMEIVNYGDANMHLSLNGSAGHAKKMTSKGSLVYRIADGKLIKEQDPYRRSSYAEVADNLIYILHFGNYGGYAVKILYFLLGIAGCAVIISGVLIWHKARDKKSTSEKKKKFNNWLTNIYLSVCLSMYPVTAAAFIILKLFPDRGMSFTYRMYFWSWLVVSLLLVLRNNNYKTNRYCLLLGSLLGLFIPITNGMTTGNWIWISFQNRYHDILLIDIFWIVLSVTTLISCALAKRRTKTDQPKRHKAITQNKILQPVDQ